jgi:hypothetical protein
MFCRFIKGASYRTAKSANQVVTWLLKKKRVSNHHKSGSRWLTKGILHKSRRKKGCKTTIANLVSLFIYTESEVQSVFSHNFQLYFFTLISMPCTIRPFFQLPPTVSLRLTETSPSSTPSLKNSPISNSIRPSALFWGSCT